MIDLSIIIVSFNTESITQKCLLALKKNFNKYPLNYEVIVVDNASTDNSQPMLTAMALSWKQLKVILSKKNLGYGKGNNLGVARAKGQFILYFNSDAIVDNLDFNDLINLFNHNSSIGALTVKVLLPDGSIDPASHRGFPTLWRSLTYFLKLEKLFKNVPILNRLFAGYHLSYLNLNTVHEIDAGTGAFLMARKSVIDKVGGIDKDFFMYGEDLELAYQIKALGLRIIYYPLWTVLHLKYSSGFKNKNTKIKSNTKFHFYESMKIFYKKHYAKDNLWIINQLVYWFIDIKRTISS